MRNILVILGVFCLVSLISAVKFFQIERATYQQYVRVKSENVKLNERISSLSQEKLKLARKLEAVRNELEEISGEAEEIKEQYNSLIGEKRELSARIEMLTREKDELEGRISEMESNGFLSRLLKRKVSLEVKVKNLEEKLEKSEKLEGEIEEITKAKLELEEQLNQEKEVSEYLSKDFLKAREEKLIALDKLERIEKEKDELRITLDRAMEERASLEKELVKLKEKLRDSLDERERLAAQITDMQGVLKERLAEVNLVRSKLERVAKKSKPKIKEVVELPPIVVKPETSSPTSTRMRPQKKVLQQITRIGGLQGKVITINEKHNFVVIDLGSNDGLEVGVVFGVYRDNKEIARIRVVETRRQIAAADIINLESRTKIKLEDIVIKKE